ncbi:hypothetical protein GCM10009601_08570 [Streptomyces thermospinosisporus]|uniref:Uncharacterized protein n=1 Tax=Streptomyces thermospinosisporus TaxID=161482 RepID=A0ABN1YKE6_9ACTN
MPAFRSNVRATRPGGRNPAAHSSRVPGPTTRPIRRRVRRLPAKKGEVSAPGTEEADKAAHAGEARKAGDSGPPAACHASDPTAVGDARPGRAGAGEAA